MLFKADVCNKQELGGIRAAPTKAGLQWKLMEGEKMENVWAIVLMARSNGRRLAWVWLKSGSDAAYIRTVIRGKRSDCWRGFCLCVPRNTPCHAALVAVRLDRVTHGGSVGIAAAQSLPHMLAHSVSRPQRGSPAARLHPQAGTRATTQPTRRQSRRACWVGGVLGKGGKGNRVLKN